MPFNESLGKRNSHDNGSDVFSAPKLSRSLAQTPKNTRERANYVDDGSETSGSAPSLTTDSGFSEDRGSTSASVGSGSGSEDGHKSESPDKDCEYPFEERLPTLESALHSVNLHLSQRSPHSQQNSYPTLPSLRDDLRVQQAFAMQQPQPGEIPRMKWKQQQQQQQQQLVQVELHTQGHSSLSQAQQAQQARALAQEPSGPNGPNGPQGPSGSHQPFTSTMPNKVASSSSDRPFRCSFDGCDWSFMRSSDQKRHLRSHKKATLQCPYWEVDSSCHRNGGAFNRLDVLKRHLKLMHYATDRDGEVGNCKICNQSFNSLRDFINHTKPCAAQIEVAGR